MSGWFDRTNPVKAEPRRLVMDFECNPTPADKHGFAFCHKQCFGEEKQQRWRGYLLTPDLRTKWKSYLRLLYLEQVHVLKPPNTVETLDRHDDVGLMLNAVTLIFQTLSILLENSALVTEVKKSGYKEISAQAERKACTYTPTHPIVAPLLSHEC